MTGPSKRLRMAFVVQRYGTDINGGAELHCRELVERLAARPDVSHIKVFTTRARDHDTWHNAYPEGLDRVHGIEVERFTTLLPRLDTLRVLLGWGALHGPRCRHLEMPWLVAQGPFAPELPRAVYAARESFDLFVFFSYLYYPTVTALPAAAPKALFVPTAHDEPALRLQNTLRLFQQARAIAFNTEEERQLVASRVDLHATRSDIVGCGVCTEPSTVAPERRDKPYLLYVGRIETGKGVPELAAGFRAFKRMYGHERFIDQTGRTYSGSDLQLVLAGRGVPMAFDRDDDIVRTGFVSDERRWALIRGCEAVVVPGLLDSLSLALLEAWVNEKLVLIPEDCPVKRGHAQRAGAGALYGKTRPFAQVLAQSLADPAERHRQARASAAYVRQHYGWPEVEQRFMNLAQFVAGSPSES